MAFYNSIPPFIDPLRGNIPDVRPNVAATLTLPYNPILNNRDMLPQSPLDRAIIAAALFRLNSIVNPAQDEACLWSMGVYPPFHSGREALYLIQRQGIKVEFGDMGDTTSHAEWESDKRRIIVNARYRGDTSPATLYAISEAIYHEAGHAWGNGDGKSSIQELNCLGLNALGYRSHVARDPSYAALASTSPLIANGVALYSYLFFGDPDPGREALVKRVAEKYGTLPLFSPGHPAPFYPGALAVRVAERVQREKMMKTAMMPQPAFSPYIPLVLSH